MPFSSMNAYWAGVGTVVLALTAGFGGGTLIANAISSDTAVPARGMSRLERVMADKQPRTVKVSGEVINALAEAAPVEPDAKPEAKSRPAELSAQDAVVTSVVRPEPVIAKALQNTAMDSIAAPGAGRSSAMEKRKRSAESRARQVRNRQDAAHVGERRAANRNLARNENDGNVRYVIRTPNGQRVSAAEIESLKQRLRERRGGEAAPTLRADALSYQPERRRGIEQLFD